MNDTFPCAVLSQEKPVLTSVGIRALIKLQNEAQAFHEGIHYLIRRKAKCVK